MKTTEEEESELQMHLQSDTYLSAGDFLIFVTCITLDRTIFR